MAYDLKMQDAGHVPCIIPIAWISSRLSENSLPAVQHPDRTIRRSNAIASRLKVTGQDVRFANSIVVEKSVRSFGVSPISASQRNISAGTRRELLEKNSKSPIDALVLEL